MCWLSVTTCYPVFFCERESGKVNRKSNWRPRRSMSEANVLCSSGSANPAPFIGSRVWLHIPFIYPSYTLALFFFFKWWDKIVQCLTAAGYSGVMPGYSPGGASLSLDKRALCREIAWRLAKDPKVGHVVVSLRLFGLGSSIVEGGGRVVGKQG